MLCFSINGIDSICFFLISGMCGHFSWFNFSILEVFMQNTLLGDVASDYAPALSPLTSTVTKNTCI